MNKLVQGAIYWTKKNSPELLLAGGLAAGAATVIFACKGTTKASQIKAESDFQLEEIENVREQEKDNPEVYSEQDYRKDISMTYFQLVIKLIKAYLPAIASGVISIGMILAAFGILKKRNISLAALAAALKAGSDGYRQRVVERFGEEVDKELFYGIRDEVVEEVKTTKDGKEKKVEKKIKTVDPSEVTDPHTLLFDSSNPNYEKDLSYNLNFLEKAEQYWNDQLDIRMDGIVLENEIREYFGQEKLEEVKDSGWVKDPNRQHQISFGVYYDSKTKIKGSGEPAIWCHFNSEGDVWNLRRERNKKINKR